MHSDPIVRAARRRGWVDHHPPHCYRQGSSTSPRLHIDCEYSSKYTSNYSAVQQSPIFTTISPLRMILNELPVCLPQDGDPAAVEHTMHPMPIGTAVKDLTPGVSYPQSSERFAGCSQYGLVWLLGKEMRCVHWTRCDGVSIAAVSP
jgi:hypothetical protein